MILGAGHRLSRIRGGDSQVPSESFVTEVISEAPLTLNYISQEEGGHGRHMRDGPELLTGLDTNKSSGGRH